MTDASAPDDLVRPASKTGLLSDLAWSLAAVALFGAIAAIEPFDITFEPTLPLAAVWVATGGAVGVGLLSVALLSNRYQAYVQDNSGQFLVLFSVAMLGQMGLLVAPTETILVVLAAFVAAVPTRILLYLRATRQRR
jgi:hypothetical protein